MTEHNRTICPECGRALSSSEQADGRCAACNSDDDSTFGRTHIVSTNGLAADHKSRSTTDALEIKDYQLIRSIGRGGMGIVYLARQLSVDRLVALKVILDERLVGLPAQQRERAIGRFLNESRAAAQLHHENIVTVFDVGESHGRHYFTMQYVDGVSLSSKLRDGPLPNRVAAQYMHVIARAVHAAHQTGVLHRDLKPGNVIVDRATDLPLVADFGLAKMLTNDSDMTMTGEIFGSPPYMSPEQARSAGDVTELADVYSLGATLYHLLAGRPPFQAATSLETLKQVIEDEPVSPREVNPAVDVDLETIALKCLNKECGRRYQTALDLSEDLGAYLDGRTISARPASTWDRVSRWGRRNRAIATWMSSTAVVLVIGTVTSVTLAFMEHQQRTTAEKNEKRAAEQTTLAQQKESEAIELAGKLELSLAEVQRQRTQARHDAFTSSLSASFAYLQNAEPQRIDDRLRRLKLTEAEVKEAAIFPSRRESRVN